MCMWHKWNVHVGRNDPFLSQYNNIGWLKFKSADISSSHPSAVCNVRPDHCVYISLLITPSIAAETCSRCWSFQLSFWFILTWSRYKLLPLVPVQNGEACSQGRVLGRQTEASSLGWRPLDVPCQQHTLHYFQLLFPHSNNVWNDYITYFLPFSCFTEKASGYNEGRFGLEWLLPGWVWSVTTLCSVHHPDKTL